MGEQHKKAYSYQSEEIASDVSRLYSELSLLAKKNESLDEQMAKEKNALEHMAHQIKKMQIFLDKESEAYANKQAYIKQLNEKNLSLSSQLKHEQQKVLSARKRRQELEEKFQKLQRTKELLLDEIEMKMETFEAEGSEYKKVENKIVKAQKEVENLQGAFALKKKRHGIYTELDEVGRAINERFNSAKNASAMFSIAHELVDVVEASESDQFLWVAKVSANSDREGMKIRFKNLQTRYSEMRKVLKPVIRKLKERFRVYGIDIETRSRTSPGEVIEAIEFKVTLKAFQDQLELR